MKNKNIAFLLLILGVMGICSCEFEAEPIQLQKDNTYSDTYYKNLRDYKASDHQVCFGWFAGYDGNMHSPGSRFTGLPDSIDIVSLWGGIPSDVPGKPNTFYNLIIHQEMRFVQKVKGTKFTFVTFPGVNNQKWVMEKPESERVKVYGDSLLRIVYNNNLDGMDLDYEIAGDWMHGANFVKLIEYLGQFIGPKGKDKSKLLIVDGWPIDGGYEYLNYFVSQAYRSTGAADLQNRFNTVSALGLDSKRYIVTETIAETDRGGHLFTDANGNTQSKYFPSEPLRSIEGMASWNPTQGPKGGFGGFRIEYDYHAVPGYKYISKGIQIQNPQVK